MKISDLSIRKPVTTTMIVLLVILLGAISLGRLNMDLLPNLSFPMAAVITNYQGVGPNEVETMVTKPLENVLATVTDIKSISSVSSSGQSMIILEFNWGVDMDFATLNMREKIDLITSYLPDDVEKPLVFKFDPSMLPILEVGITGEDDLVSLKQLIENKVIPRIERLKGVASVGLTGGLNREILVELDQTKLNSYGLNMATINQTLMMENMDLSGGEITRGLTQILIRTKGKFASLDEIKKILIPTASGFVALEDLGEVKDTYQEVLNMARMDGLPSIGLTIQKQTDANTVTVSNLVKRELIKIKSELSDEIGIEFLMDQSQFIETAIGNVTTNAILGGLLAILVLFLFLRNIRSTIIIATAIPISVITTFSLVYFSGLTLNMMTLGGLALGIGMLVDNAIVVLENIYRYRQEGYGAIEAASLGSQEVGMAIVASTLTTAIVFLPVVFVEGIASELFKELALTITFSLIASLIVALTFIPMASAKILKVSKKEMTANKEKKGIISGIIRRYRSSLDWCLSHRLLVMVVLILCLVGSFALFPLIGAEFIPSMDQGELTINVKLPIGTVLSQTNEVVAGIEEQLMSIPEVDTVFTRIGSSGQMMSANDSSAGSLLVKLKKLSDRERSIFTVMEEIRQKIRIPDTEVTVQALNSMGGGAMGGAPISIKVEGSDLDVLEDLTVKVTQEMAQVSGVREIKDSMSKGRPEMQIKIDRVQAAKYGLRVTHVAAIIKSAIQGDVATRYEVGGQEYDVRVRLKEDHRQKLSQVKDLLIPSPMGSKVSLNQIASFTFEQAPKAIQRKNQVRYAEITADIYDTDLDTAMKAIQARVAENVAIPDQYRIVYGGQFEEMIESFKGLALALVLAVLLMYMVLASQFESLLRPFIIMFTVPMAAIGVFLGLYVCGHRISVVSLIGIIMLAGIVVNNAIVLVDYISTLQKKGLSMREAILEAGPIRLRPILMTALTTILALLPLALGISEGSEVQAPMAVVVIGGLTCATILTLYIIPVLYSLFTGFSNRLKRLFHGSEKNTEIYS